MTELYAIHSVSELLQLTQSEGAKHPLVAVLYHNDPRINMDFGDSRVVMDLYYISIKSGVEGSLGYGRNSYDFDDGSIVFIAPGQVLTPGKIAHQPDNEGWSLVFHPDLLRRSELANTIDSYSFFSYEVTEALHLSQSEIASLTAIVHTIEQEYGQNLDKHSQKLIVANVALLLDYCTRYYDRQFITRSNLNKDIVGQFEQLLKRYYQSEQHLKTGLPSVQYCGEALHLSAPYLSDLLKNETGKSALEHIHNFVIERSKNFLLGSNEPISEIAYALGFEYPQHFSKLFKTKTGMTPKGYRGLN